MNWVGDIKSIIEPFTNFIISVTGLGAMYWGGKKIAASIRQREKKADVIVDRGFYQQYVDDREEMKKDIIRIREEHASEMRDIRAEQAKERELFALDRQTMQAKYDRLLEDFEKVREDNRQKDIIIAELRGEVQGLRISVGKVKIAMDESDQHYNTGSV